MPNWYEYMEELATMGMVPHADKIELVLQPANSPDLNINDLGFFRALQSLYYQEAPRNAGEIITMVETAYIAYPSKKINYLWLTLQNVFNEIVKVHGDNTYILPHMNKEKLDKEDALPIVINCCDEVVTFIEKAYPTIYQLADLSSSDDDDSLDRSAQETNEDGVDYSRVI
jgi:hypothetical protein